MKYLASILRRALVRHEFVPFYQPIFKAGTVKIIGCEVQVCWLHPEQGLLNTAIFINSIEHNSNLLELMTCELMDMLSMDLHKYKSDIPDDFLLSINCSLSLLMSGTFRQRLVHLGRECSDINMRLLAEITKSENIQDFPDISQVIRLLRQQNIEFVLDNYIGQYCDYDQLARINPDYIKLDKSYLLDVMTSATAQQRVDDLIGLSGYLGCQMIAEGIENIAQINYLKNKRISYWQGDFCGSPMSAELFYCYLEVQQQINNKIRRYKSSSTSASF